MSHRWSFVALTALLALGGLSTRVLAQTSPRASLVVTVVDPSGAVLPQASVTVAGLDDANKASAPAPAETTSNGAATFPGLVPGRYSIRAEFPGFEPGTAPGCPRQPRRQQADDRPQDREPLRIRDGGAGRAGRRAPIAPPTRSA